MINSGFVAMAPVHHALDKYVGLYRNAERDGYAEMFELFERWMHSDVPLAGQIFREVMGDIFKRNLLVNGGFNVVAEHDDVVHPRSSLPLPDLIGSTDKRNLVFPTGHIGAVVSAGSHKKLWPQIGDWMAERDQ